MFAINITEITDEIGHTNVYYECSMGNDYIINNGNEAFYALIGKNSFKPFTYGIHPEDADEFTGICESLEKGGTAVLVFRYQGSQEGRYKLYEVTITHNISAAGEILGYNVRFLNLLALKNIYERNTKNVKKYRTFMSMISVYYYEYNRQKNFFKVYIYTNGKSYLLVNEDFDIWYDEMLEGSVKTEKDRASLAGFARALKSGKSDFTIHLCGAFFSKGDTSEELICTGKAVSLHGVKNVFGVIRNVEGYIDRNRAYYFTEAGKDSATGLLNKRASKEFSKDLLSDGTGARRYMLIIDIDDFKNFNDSYGHIFGDDVILRVARVLSENINLRGIVGRIGGDEFYILTENIESEDDLRVLLKTIAKNLFYIYENDKEDVHVTTSIGVSCYPDDGASYDELFRKADKALYIAKEKGKNRFIIYDEEKHGAVSGDADAEKIRLSLKSGQYAAAVSELMLKLADEKSAAVKEVMAEALKVFDIDKAKIVSAADGRLLYSFGEKEAFEEEKYYSFIGLDEYKRLYTDSYVYVENNVQNIEKFSKTVSKAMLERNVLSFMHVAYPDTDNPEAFIFFDVCKALRKWSDEDRNLLMMLGRLLLNAICRAEK